MITEITEDYVSFETAKLLKEKGFSAELLCVYIDTEKSDKKPCLLDTLCNYNDGHIKDVISAPTLQMAVKWLRKEKGIAVIPIISSVLDNEKFLWDVKVVVAKTNETYSQGWIYEEPERACEAALKYSLENLI